MFVEMISEVKGNKVMSLKLIVFPLTDQVSLPKNEKGKTYQRLFVNIEPKKWI